MWLGVLTPFILLYLETFATAERQQVAVVVGTHAPDLERYASNQLCHYLDKLYNIQVQTTTEPTQSAEIYLLVGSPITNPTVAHTVKNWPQVSDQAIILKRAKFNDKPALVIGGGSPRATMWAMYEMVQRWGGTLSSAW